MNFYKHYIGDFQRDTGHLSLTERGAYLALMHHYYATEQAIPSEHSALCRIAGAFSKPDRDAVKVAAKFFESRDGLLWHKRIEAELGKQDGRADTNRRIAMEREARKRAEKAAQGQHEQSTIRAPNVSRKPHETLTIDSTNGARETARTEHEPSTPQNQSHSQKTTSSNSINTSSTPYSHHSAVRLNGSHSAGLPKPEDPPDCPQQRIRDLWAELMPELQQPVKWTPARATTLRARWREEAGEHSWSGEDDGLKFFAKLFRWCRKSDFLMGRAPARSGATPFSLTVPWLIKAENWAKVQEGNYHEGSQ